MGEAFQHTQTNLGLGVAVGLQLMRGNADLGGNLGDGLGVLGPRDSNVGRHGI